MSRGINQVMVLIMMQIGAQTGRMRMDVVPASEICSSTGCIGRTNIHWHANTQRVSAADKVPGGVVLGMVRRSIANGCVVSAGKSRMVLVGCNPA